MISVTFDSNLIQKVLIPGEYSDDPEYNDLLFVNSAIINKRISAVVSEMFFTQEAICKKDRKFAFQENAKAGTSVTVDYSDSQIVLRVTIGPSSSAHLKMSETLLKYATIMRKYGVKILKTYRLGDFINDDLKFTDYYICPTYSTDDVQLRNADCCDYIENELGAGKALLDTYLAQYPGKNIYQKSENVPDADYKKYAKLVAEMADGQSIAIHFANNIDYFCTRDEAHHAGQQSVLSIQNRTKMMQKFSIKIINLQQLTNLLNSQSASS